jgi:hypothetical protein
MKPILIPALAFALSGLAVVEYCRAFPMASTLAAVGVIVVAALSGKRVER